MLHQEWILMELKVEYRFDGNKCAFRITQTILAMQLPKYFFFPFLYLGNWRHCQMFERPKNSLLLPRYHSCQRQRPDACIFCWSYRWPLYKQRRGIWFRRYIYYYCYQVCIMFLGNKILTLRSLIVVYARLAIIPKNFVNLHVCRDLHIYEIK